MAWLRGWDYSRDISAGEATENRRSGYGITKICKNKNKSQKPSSDSRTRRGGTIQELEERPFPTLCDWIEGNRRRQEGSRFLAWVPEWIIALFSLIVTIEIRIGLGGNKMNFEWSV